MLLIEFSSCAQRPIGIAQEFPGNNDRVRLSGANDVFGLNWRSDRGNSRSGSARKQSAATR